MRSSMRCQFKLRTVFLLMTGLGLILACYSYFTRRTFRYEVLDLDTHEMIVCPVYFNGKLIGQTPLSLSDERFWLGFNDSHLGVGVVTGPSKAAPGLDRLEFGAVPGYPQIRAPDGRALMFIKRRGPGFAKSYSYHPVSLVRLYAVPLGSSSLLEMRVVERKVDSAKLRVEFPLKEQEHPNHVRLNFSGIHRDRYVTLFQGEAGIYDQTIKEDRMTFMVDVPISIQQGIWLMGALSFDGDEGFHGRNYVWLPGSQE